jgi:hypothetical protein
MDTLEKIEQIRQEILEEKLKLKSNIKYIRKLQQMLDKLYAKHIESKFKIKWKEKSK